jgi:hypothetical protein
LPALAAPRIGGAAAANTLLALPLSIPIDFRIAAIA